MTVTVNFSAAQAQLDNGSTGVQLAQVILPYSIRNSEDSTKYLGGQMTLFPSDGIKLSDNTKDWEHLALIKIKKMVADAEMYVPEPIAEVPKESEAEVPVSSAVEVPASSADNSATSSEAPVSSAEAPVSSAAPVNSEVEAPVSSASAAETSEAPVPTSEPTVNTSVTESPVNSETEAQ